MPELPEVEALVRFLDQRLAGHEVSRAEVGTISALKTFDPPLSSLVGRRVKGVSRRGKFLLLQCSEAESSEPLWMVMHLARAGWIRWRDELPATPARPGRGSLALRLGVVDDGGLEATEAGTEKRLALWVVRSPSDVEPVSRLGVDPLDPGISPKALEVALSSRKGTLKNALTDQSLLAGIGNAYSDEIMHAARLSPFRPATKLTPDEVARLCQSVTDVLSQAVERSAGLPASGLKEQKRSGMKVHGRTGQECPACGDRIREVAFSNRSLQYCPTCQTGGKVLADRRLSRLLK